MIELRFPRLLQWSSLGLAISALAACSAGGAASGANGSNADDGTIPTTGEGGAAAIPSGGQGANVNLDLDGVEQRATPSAYCLPEPFPKDFPSWCLNQPSGPWAEALQKSLWFFNVNKSGPGVYCTDVQWRGDAHLGDGHIKLDPNDPNGVVHLSAAFIDANRDVLDPDGDGEVDLAGGYHDAGDYIKFTLTTAYAASMIAWSMHEFPDAYLATGLAGEALGQIRWATDYLMKATFIRDDGDPSSIDPLVAYAHQVSDSSDHACFWMPPEVRRTDFCPRKAYFVTAEDPASDVTAAAAATLALAARVVYDFRETQADVAYAERAVQYAKSLYQFASQYPEVTASDTDGLYNSNSTNDDLAWAAIWLYLVNPAENEAYLQDVIGGDAPWLSYGNQATLLNSATATGIWVPEWAESSPHSWDSMRAGVILKMAQIATARGDSVAADWVDVARQMSLDFVSKSDPANGGTPDGFYVYMSWGSARYNSAAQFTSLLFAKYFPQDEASPQLVTWAKDQMAYIMGDNDLGKSFIMGYTDSYALQPHHAAGHASIYGEPAIPAENRHIIWGALVNGPQGDGSHVDARADYGSNEVTIDYNASLVAALAGHYQTAGLGECPMMNFPPLEQPIDEFYAMGSLNNELGGCRTQVHIRTVNETIHPPRYDETLTTRFWFDATELMAAGLDPHSVVTLNLMRDTGANYEGPTGVIGPVACDEAAGTYYFEFDYTGALFWGEIPAIGAPRELMIDYGVQNNPGCVWDPTNDWSNQFLPVASNTEVVKTPYITVYSNGELIWGEEPPCNGEQKKVEPPPPLVYVY